MHINYTCFVELQSILFLTVADGVKIVQCRKIITMNEWHFRLLFVLLSAHSTFLFVLAYRAGKR